MQVDPSAMTFVVGRIAPDAVQMLGTCFLVSPDGFLATTHHVVGNEAANLVVLAPAPDSFGYQDLSINRSDYAAAKPVEIDPVRDIAILKVEGLRWNGPFPNRSNFDRVSVGAQVGIFGFPHCVYGRRAFTLQTTEIGAKVLIENHGVKSKHAVINTQTRPGQSGSPVLSPDDGSILGMLVGAWVPGPAGIRLGDINPHELHQTTQCVSAQHIWEML